MAKAPKAASWLVWTAEQLGKGALQAVSGVFIYMLAAFVLVRALAKQQRVAVNDALRWKSPVLVEAAATGESK